MHGNFFSSDKETIRARLHEIMSPYEGAWKSTQLSLIVDVFILGVVLLSCIIVPLSFLFPGHETLFRVVDVIITALFIIEYAIRIYAAPKRWRCFKRWDSLLDLLVVLCSVVLVVVDLGRFRLAWGIRLLKIARLLRFVRVLKFFRYLKLVRMGAIRLRIRWASLVHTFRLKQLFRLLMVTLLVSFIGTTLLHVTETGDLRGLVSTAPEQETASTPDALRRSKFSDYWTCYWNTVIMLVSGIEDKEPTSVLGRVEAVFVLIFGIVIVSLLTGEIVSVLVILNQRVGRIRMMPPNSPAFREHILILGANEHLERVISQLYEAYRGRRYIVVLDKNADKLKAGTPKVFRKVFALSGNPLDARSLSDAAFTKAHSIIVLSTREYDSDGSRDSLTLMSTLSARLSGQQNRDSGRVDNPRHITVEINKNESLQYTSILDGVGFVNGHLFAEQLISQTVLHRGISHVYERLMQFSRHTNEFYLIDVPDGLIGRTFLDAQKFFFNYDQLDLILIGMVKCSVDGCEDLLLCPQGMAPTRQAFPSLELTSDDRLVVIAFYRPTGFGETEMAQIQRIAWKEGRDAG